MQNIFFTHINVLLQSNQYRVSFIINTKSSNNMTRAKGDIINCIGNKLPGEYQYLTPLLKNVLYYICFVIYVNEEIVLF